MMTERRDRVLIVEDDPQVRDVVRRYLEATRPGPAWG
jgi:CheY-like chemotaxis protein